MRAIPSLDVTREAVEAHPTTRTDLEQPRVVRSVDQSDPIEAALADALTKAAAAARFDVVAQLAKELEARRSARSGVVDLEAEARKRGRR